MCAACWSGVQRAARRGKPKTSIQTPPSPRSFRGLVSPVQYPRRCLESAGNVGSRSLLAGLLRADSPLKSFCFGHMHSGVDPTIGTEAGECAGRLLPGRGPESANHRSCHTGELSARMPGAVPPLTVTDLGPVWPTQQPTQHIHHSIHSSLHSAARATSAGQQ